MEVIAMTMRSRLTRPETPLYRRLSTRRGARPVIKRNRKTEAGVSARAEDRRLQQGEQPQDQALYTCQCGFFFEAPVSTSVDCPHCGSSQAW